MKAFVSALAVAVLLVTGESPATVNAAVLGFPPYSALRDGNSIFSANSLDPRYDRWLTPGRIFYYIDDSYLDGEKDMIHGALMTISINMNQCVDFREYNVERDTGREFLYISKHMNDGASPPTCVTFPGRVVRAAGQGQKVVIHDGPNGCMDSIRSIMKVVVNALGLRNEYRRPDRDQYLMVTPQNLEAGLQGSTLLEMYNQSDVYYANFPFDYFSVTMPSPAQYAAVNSTVYTVPGMASIPYLDTLSYDDCSGLAWLYSCNPSACTDPYKDVALSLKLSPPVPTSGNTTQNVGFVLLSPSASPNKESPRRVAPAEEDTVFHVVALNSLAGQEVFAKGRVPSNFTTGDANSGRVNITLTYSGNGTNGQSFLLDKNASIAGIEPQPGSAVTLHLENVSNATAYIGIYGPPGFAGGFISAINGTAVVYNGTKTDYVTPASASSMAATLSSSATKTAGTSSSVVVSTNTTPHSLFP